jgi:LytS/YehU family sensor histidine kinase
MLIQPFVENAIEHAFVDRKENRRIEIDVNLVDQELICLVKDNGVGLSATRERKSIDKKSLSTAITTERLKILSRDFKMRGDVSVEDREMYQEQGTIVRLTLPYIKEA